MLLLTLALSPPTGMGVGLTGPDPMGRITVELVSRVGEPRRLGEQVTVEHVLAHAVRLCYLQEVAWRPETPPYPLSTSVDLRVEPDGHITGLRTSDPAPAACAAELLAAVRLQPAASVTVEALRVAVEEPPASARLWFLEVSPSVLAQSGPARAIATGEDLVAVVAARVRSCHVRADPAGPVPATYAFELHARPDGLVDELRAPGDPVGDCVRTLAGTLRVLPADNETAVVVEVALRRTAALTPPVMWPEDPGR